MQRKHTCRLSARESTSAHFRDKESKGAGGDTSSWCTVTMHVNTCTPQAADRRICEHTFAWLHTALWTYEHAGMCYACHEHMNVWIYCMMNICINVVPWTYNVSWIYESRNTSAYKHIYYVINTYLYTTHTYTYHIMNYRRVELKKHFRYHLTPGCKLVSSWEPMLITGRVWVFSGFTGKTWGMISDAWWG